MCALNSIFSALNTLRKSDNLLSKLHDKLLKSLNLKRVLNFVCYYLVVNTLNTWAIGQALALKSSIAKIAPLWIALLLLGNCRCLSLYQS